MVRSKNLTEQVLPGELLAQPVVPATALLRRPELRAALVQLAGRAGVEDMRRMNNAGDGRREDAAAVVRAFLDATRGEV